MSIGSLTTGSGPRDSALVPSYAGGAGPLLWTVSSMRMTHPRPQFWAGLTGAFLLGITAGAYYYWYQVLVARGYGYMYNAMKYQTGFAIARYCLGVGLCAGCLTYELTWRSLSKVWRIAYVLLLGAGLALFAVHWVVVHFAVTPFWHHP